MPHTSCHYNGAPQEDGPLEDSQVLRAHPNETGGGSTSSTAVPVGVGVLASLPANNADVETGTRSDKRCESLGAPAVVDMGAAVMPQWMRVGIFVIVCQGVQMFMSYDGGATPASLDTIQQEMENAWTPAEFGILGAMDKIGMTVTSLFWGRLLQLAPAKYLLLLGLGLNTVCTFTFGCVRHKTMMYLLKFVMGATQSLQGVWATVWTVTMAPPAYKTMWLGLGGVSAGIGNGIGTAVAGFGTANGLDYSFAFQLQAAVLALCFVFVVANPVPWLALRTETEEELEKSDLDATPRSTSSKPSTISQLKEAWRKKVYGWTSLAISSAMFQMSGIQFLWTRVFVEVWGLNKNAVTLMFLAITGVGGGVGLGMGPRYIDMAGGFGTAPGVKRSLGILRTISVIAALAGILGVAALFGKLRSKDQGYLKEWGDHWLWLTWMSVFLIWAGRNACIPGLCGINVEVMPENMRPFSSGMEMTMRNILGYAFGPLLPGFLMDFVASIMNSHPKTENDWALCCGLAFVFLGNLLDYGILCRAYGGACHHLEEEQTRAFDMLRNAFQAEDIPFLERAVTFAKSVDLHKRTDGEAVLGMANETIGAFHYGTFCKETAFKRSATVLATSRELRERIAVLEEELIKAKDENRQLHCALSEAQESLIIRCGSSNSTACLQL